MPRMSWPPCETGRRDSTLSSPAGTPTRGCTKPPTWSPRCARSSTRWMPGRRASGGSRGDDGDERGDRVRLPRIVIAAPASGHGKTTVATGLMAALRRAGHEVSGHKIGPDYIDPGYHALATGRPGRNLGPHLVGEDRLVPLLLRGAAHPRPADVAIGEGVMGLFDGAIGRAGFASTAHVAGLIDA